MSTDDDARAEFLRGARLKIEGRRLMVEGQDAMERGAWLATDQEDRHKTDVPQVLASWLRREGITDFTDLDTLGVGEHSVLRWLAPRNRERVLPKGGQ